MKGKNNRYISFEVPQIIYKKMKFVYIPSAVNPFSLLKYL